MGRRESFASPAPLALAYRCTQKRFLESVGPHAAKALRRVDDVSRLSCMAAKMRPEHREAARDAVGFFIEYFELVECGSSEAAGEVFHRGEETSVLQRAFFEPAGRLYPIVG